MIYTLQIRHSGEKYYYNMNQPSKVNTTIQLLGPNTQ